MSHQINRRTVLSMGAAVTASLALPAYVRAAALPSLTLWGPPAGPSITLAHAVSEGFLGDIAARSDFKMWRNPDELRAGLSSKNIKLSVVPVQAAANLYNRGFPIKLVNVMTKGLLYVVTADASITDMASLAGKHLAVPFRGDTPDIVLDRLLDEAGLQDENAVKISHLGNPIAAVQMLMTGRADAALLPEPAISAVILKGKKRGKIFKRAIDIQAEWGALIGTKPIIPQAGLAVSGPFMTNHPGVVADIHGALVVASAAVLADPKAAAANAAKVLKLPKLIIAASIPHSNLGAWKAAEMRGPIEEMLKIMAEVDPKKIGGKLPDAGFYL